jgi:hypothetical protein
MMAVVLTKIQKERLWQISQTEQRLFVPEAMMRQQHWALPSSEASLKLFE